MKKVLTIASVIILATTGSAFATISPVNHSATYDMQFSKMLVQDGIEITLVESSEKLIEFEGSDADVAKVDWKIKDGTLQVSSKKGSLKGKVKLIISVSGLQEIHLKEGTTVRSQGKLNSAWLTIYLDGDCFAAVANEGQIVVEEVDDTELEVKKIQGDVIFS